ncbi:MAG: hypothetical protein JO040_08975 [Gemmatimonadetes bacterium]|nr:hypothetical protein [Gemmatimonadota bacterium]
MSPTGQVSAGLSSCSMLGAPSAQYARAAHRSPFRALQQIGQIQARYSYSHKYDRGAQQAAWKQVASGDC